MNRPAVLKGDDDNDLLALSACYVDCGAGCMHLLGIYLSVCVAWAHSSKPAATAGLLL